MHSSRRVGPVQRQQPTSFQQQRRLRRHPHLLKRITQRNRSVAHGVTTGRGVSLSLSLCSSRRANITASPEVDRHKGVPPIVRRRCASSGHDNDSASNRLGDSRRNSTRNNNVNDRSRSRRGGSCHFVVADGRPSRRNAPRNNRAQTLQRLFKRPRQGSLPSLSLSLSPYIKMWRRVRVNLVGKRERIIRSTRRQHRFHVSPVQSSFPTTKAKDDLTRGRDPCSRHLQRGTRFWTLSIRYAPPNGLFVGGCLTPRPTRGTLTSWNKHASTTHSAGFP